MYLVTVILFLIRVTSGQNISKIIKFLDNSESVLPAIVNGVPVGNKDMPFAVRIYILKLGALSHCTGEAVATSLVLTAAHCLDGYSSAIVVAGDTDQTDYVKGKNKHKYARYVAKEVFIHPKYDRNEPIHDVAIIKTGRRMMHPGHGILPLSYAKIPENAKAIVFGFGQIQKYKTNHRLYATFAEAVTCTTDSASSYEYICLLGDKVDCGDSGGAFLVNMTGYGVASFKGHYHLPYNQYFASLHEEESFVRTTIEKNSSNYNKTLFDVINIFLLYYLLFLVIL